MKRRILNPVLKCCVLFQSVRPSWALGSHKRGRREIGLIRSKFATGLTVALALSSPGAFAAKDAIQTMTPIQAELMADMNARLLSVGAIVYARVTVGWQGTECVLKNGAILEGHVLSVTSYRQNGKTSEVGIAFTRAQCGEPTMGAFELLLSALAAPPQNSDLGILTSPLPFSTSAGHTAAQGWGGIAALGAMQQGAILNLQMDMHLYKFPVTPRMRMGEVDGIKGLKLDVATGPENSSVLTCRGHDVALEKHTLLLLIPARGIFPRGPTDPDAARPVAARVARDGPTLPSDVPAKMAAPPPVDDLDSCVPPQCNVALPPGPVSDGAKPATSISIRELGYAPRPRRTVRDFDQDEVLAYLAPGELLVTFNPHVLVTRHTLGRSESTVRVIRAALIDTETLRVTRTVDWELPDNREYVWPLTDGRVLVHVGSELRVYGEGLNILNRIPLEGPLNFVRATPDGSFVALGLTHERHSPELHAQLAESLDREPEEDVEVLVLNRNFETIARSSTQSGLVPPTLLDEGQARVMAQPNMRYRLSMVTWDNQASTLARFNSSCTPELSSLTPDLIFLESCDRQTHVLQYRVLHSNGKLELKGGSNPNDFDHAAKGSTNRYAFVVKTVQSNSLLAPGDHFSAADLSSEVLEVYRATDGRRLLGVRVNSPSASRDGYALAPDSSQLAVLTRDQISIYSVANKNN